jgi:hypothetical protein
MIVEMNKQGVVTLTAESKPENETLFSIANDANFKATATYSKPKSDAPKKRAHYIKNCPVQGCDHKTKGITMHMLTRHGVQRDGSLKDTFHHATGGPNCPVSEPVTEVSKGVYKLRSSVQASGMLGDVKESDKPSFLGSRIIS